MHLPTDAFLPNLSQKVREPQTRPESNDDSLVSDSDLELKVIQDDLESDTEDYARSNEDGWFYSSD